MNNLTARTNSLNAKYLAFCLGQDQFVVPAFEVREIIGIQEITPIPLTGAHVKGVINLRGRVIPIFDLRLRLGREATPYNSRTCIMVTQKNSVVNGIVVDGVSDVISLAATDIHDTPDLGTGVSTPYTSGIADIHGKTTLVLNLDQVLGVRQTGVPAMPKQAAA